MLSFLKKQRRIFDSVLYVLETTKCQKLCVTRHGSTSAIKYGVHGAQDAGDMNLSMLLVGSEMGEMGVGLDPLALMMPSRLQPLVAVGLGEPGTTPLSPIVALDQELHHLPSPFLSSQVCLRSMELPLK